MTTNEKSLVITIGLLLISLILLVLSHADKIDGQETLRKVVLNQVRC